MFSLAACIPDGFIVKWGGRVSFPTHGGTTIMLNEAFDLFAKAAPATVMIRAVLENILSENRLNAIFEDMARVQYTRELAFSSVVRLMSQVVMRIRPSVYAAYREQVKELEITAKSVYDKLNGIEPAVSREMVCRTAREMELVIRTMGGELPSMLPGFRIRILDGNHFAGTDRRLKLLRGQGGAALPGQALAVLDPALKLIVDLFPCEDAHTQERALLSQVLEVIEAGDLWIEDRNFCTNRFLFGIARKQAAFLVRQHAGLPWKALEEPAYVGKSETGRVFEQRVRLIHADGEELVVRRITIELHHPTRDGETVLHLLTNLTVEDADALTLARLYSQRWQIETAFQELTVDLCCEVSTLGYPKAALFGFSVAVLCYNAFSVTKAAIRVNRVDPTPTQFPSSSAPVPVARATTKPPLIDELSTYYLADEVAGTWRGMMVVLPEPFWKQKFADLSTVELADVLKNLAGRVDMTKYRQRPPSKKRSVRKPPCQPGSHVSTARILQTGRLKRNCHL
jgi:IS4 transposase